MKLRGEYVVRKVMDDVVAIPVGQTALGRSDMMLLNDVSKVIWSCLERGTELQDIVTAVTDSFDVSESDARTDILEFVDKLGLSVEAILLTHGHFDHVNGAKAFFRGAGVIVLLAMAKRNVNVLAAVQKQNGNLGF